MPRKPWADTTAKIKTATCPDPDTPWYAYRDGQEERTRMYGWGNTEMEAVWDMLRLEQEERGECAAEEQEMDWESMKPPSQIFGRR